MQREHVVILGHDSRPNPSEFLHVSPGSQQQSNVDAHGSHIGACLAAHPEDAQLLLGIILDQLALINGSDPQFPLDSRDATNIYNYL